MFLSGMMYYITRSLYTVISFILLCRERKREGKGERKRKRERYKLFACSLVNPY